MHVDNITDQDGVSNDEKTDDKVKQLSHKTEERKLLQTSVHVNGEIFVSCVLVYLVIFI